MRICELNESPKKSSDDNLIPLINVVFLMLIFFMVAGVIRASMPAELSLPQAQVNGSINQQAISLWVDGSTRLYSEGVWLDKGALTTHLRRIIAMTETPSDLQINLHVDHELSADSLFQVLQKIRQAGLLKVHLMTEWNAAYE